MKRLLLVSAPLLLLACTATAQDKGKDPKDPVHIAADGVELDQFIKTVSADLDIRFLYDDKILKRKVTLLSPVDIQRKDEFSVLLSVLEMQGFTLVKAGPPEAEIWKVLPFSTPIANPPNKGILQTVQLKDLATLPMNEQLACLVVTLQYIDARSAFIVVQGMVSDPRMVQPVEGANAVIVTDTAQNLHRIGEVVKLMDQPRKVQGAASVAVDAYVFDAAAQAANAAAGAEALLKQLTASANGDAVRLLEHWSGTVLDGRPVQVNEEGKSIHLTLLMTPELPHASTAAGPAAQGKEAPPALLLGPSDGEVALKANLSIAQKGEPGASYDGATTLCGKEGEWLLWTMQSAAEEGRVQLFFAKVSR